MHREAFSRDNYLNPPPWCVGVGAARWEGVNSGGRPEPREDVSEHRKPTPNQLTGPKPQTLELYDPRAWLQSAAANNSNQAPPKPQPTPSCDARTPAFEQLDYARWMRRHIVTLRCLQPLSQKLLPADLFAISTLNLSRLREHEAEDG